MATIKLKKSNTENGDYEALLAEVDRLMEETKPGETSTATITLELENDDENDKLELEDEPEEEENNG